MENDKKRKGSQGSISVRHIAFEDEGCGQVDQACYHGLRSVGGQAIQDDPGADGHAQVLGGI